MVGILLLTHAPLGNAFIEAATHVFRMRPERLESIYGRADQHTADQRRQGGEFGQAILLFVLPDAGRSSQSQGAPVSRSSGILR